MSKISSNFCCGDGSNHENKFVIMVDDTEECKRPEKCDCIIQGTPVHQVFIDLSECKRKKCKID